MGLECLTEKIQNSLSFSGTRVIRGRWSGNLCHFLYCLVHIPWFLCLKKVSSFVLLENVPDILGHLYVFISEWAEAASTVPWAWIFLLFLIRLVACPGNACMMSSKCFNEAQVLQLFPGNALCFKFKPGWTHQRRFFWWIIIYVSWQSRAILPSVIKSALSQLAINVDSPQ